MAFRYIPLFPIIKRRIRLVIGSRGWLCRLHVPITCADCTCWSHLL